MTEDRELDAWREQWSSIAEASTDGQRKIQQRIKKQNQRYVIGNLMSAIMLAGFLLFALVMRHQSGWLGTGWATGICVLVFVSAAYRVWILRGTLHPETQTTRAFVELWHKRVLARIRLLQISIYVSLGWIILCTALTAANWTTIGQDVMAHPKDWVELLIACVLMQPVIWYWAVWLRRRKLAELNEVNIILDEMDD
jgi:glucan phosphoethanolaminetransferase (alkaline phosphatase superfamily)